MSRHHDGDLGPAAVRAVGAEDGAGDAGVLPQHLPPDDLRPAGAGEGELAHVVEGLGEGGSHCGLGKVSEISPL